MCAQADKAGDDWFLSGVHVAGPVTHVVSDSQRRPALGYLRAPLSMPDRDVEQMRRKLTTYAESKGFALLRFFVDQDPAHTVGFARLISALKRGDAAYVLVPALHHFGHFPSVRLAIKELLESQTGARVIAMYSDVEGLA